jgi:anti-anti-sigma factor
MEIRKTETENGILFFIRGSLTGTQKSTMQLFEVVSLSLDKDHKGIVIDLRDTTFIDSMSIGLLVGVLLKAKEKNIELRFQNIPHQIGHILEATKLKKVFPALY